MKTRSNHTNWKSVTLAVTVSLLMSGVASAAPTQAPLTVTLPTATMDTSLPTSYVYIEPVDTTNIVSSLDLIGFQGDFTFDSTVVTFDPDAAVQAAGLTGGTGANSWTVAGAILPGVGPIKTLRVLGAVNDGMTPLNGSGLLFELRMLRVSPTPGAMSSLDWAAPPDNFFFYDSDLNPHVPDPNTGPNTAQNNGLITITGATPTPTATATPISISGTVRSCVSPTLNPVPGVTMTLTGSASGSTLSDVSGNYTFTGLPSGGNYTVTPSIAPRTPGSPNINGTDVLAVQRHFLNIALIPAGCRRVAADVDGAFPPGGNGTINGVDVVAVQKFFLGNTSGTANVGKYQFTPASSTYTAVTSDQTGQNYDALVFGDVNSVFVHRAEGPSQDKLR